MTTPNFFHLWAWDADTSTTGPTLLGLAIIIVALVFLYRIGSALKGLREELREARDDVRREVREARQSRVLRGQR